MKVIAVVESVWIQGVGQESMERLHHILGTQISSPFFECQVDITDPRWGQIKELLDNTGLEVWKCVPPLDNTKHYMLQYKVEYDVSDLSECRYIVLDAPRGHFVEAEGQIPGQEGYYVTMDWLKTVDDADLVDCDDTFIVPDRVVRLFVSARLRGIRYHPLIVLDERTGRVSQGEASGGPWWKLAIEHTVAPPRPALESPHSPHPISNPPHVYTAQDLAAIEPFDLAMAPTRNGFGHMLLVPRRVYDLFRANKLKVQAGPVVIDG